VKKAFHKEKKVLFFEPSFGRSLHPERDFLVQNDNRLCFSFPIFENKIEIAEFSCVQLRKQGYGQKKPNKLLQAESKNKQVFCRNLCHCFIGDLGFSNYPADHSLTLPKYLCALLKHY